MWCYTCSDGPHAGHVPRRDRGDVKPQRTIQLLASFLEYATLHTAAELDPPSPQGPLEAYGLCSSQNSGHTAWMRSCNQHTKVKKDTSHDSSGGVWQIEPVASECRGHWPEQSHVLGTLMVCQTGRGWRCITNRPITDGCTLSYPYSPPQTCSPQTTSITWHHTPSSKQQCTQKGSHLHKHFGKVLQAREHAGVESAQAPILAILCVSRLHAHQWFSCPSGRHSRPLHGAPAEPDATGACLQAVQLAPMRKQYVTCLDLLGRMGFNIMRQGAIHHLLDMYRTTANYSKI
jgi:hypothetical protein